LNEYVCGGYRDIFNGSAVFAVFAEADLLVFNTEIVSICFAIDRLAALALLKTLDATRHGADTRDGGLAS